MKKRWFNGNSFLKNQSTYANCKKIHWTFEFHYTKKHFIKFWSLKMLNFASKIVISKYNLSDLHLVNAKQKNYGNLCLKWFASKFSCKEEVLLNKLKINIRLSFCMNFSIITSTYTTNASEYSLCSFYDVLNKNHLCNVGNNENVERWVVSDE